MILNHKVHVLTRKEELDGMRLAGKVAIVLDVLFATSTIVTALANGAHAVIPTLDGSAALAESKRHDATRTVLAGELHSITLEGFAPPTPLALVAHGVSGKTIVYSTTNGTIALHAAAQAEHVYVGALVNGRALVEHVLAQHRDRTVLLVCAGSIGYLNLEDLYTAGYFVELFIESLGAASDLSDAARVARLLFRSGEPYERVIEGRVGRMMIERGLTHELEYACRLSALDVVAALVGGSITRVT